MPYFFAHSCIFSGKIYLLSCLIIEQKKAILADGFEVMIWLRPLVIKLEVKSKSAQFMHEYIE